MAFSGNYILRCMRMVRLWVRKRPVVGDWYLDLATNSLDVISGATLDQVEFASGRYVFLPDVEDWLELIDNRVEFAGLDPASKELRITYGPDSGWRVEVKWGKLTTIAFSKDSLHDALANTCMNMALRL